MNTPHLSEEVIEKYILGGIAEPEQEAVEDHLLICAVCQDEIKKAEVFLKVFRSAAPKLAAAPPSVWDRLRSIVAIHPGTVWTGASALSAVLLMAALIPMGSHTVQHIDLSTARGLDAGVSHAKAKTALDLQIDVTELPAASVYTVELVSASGTVIGAYTSEAKASRLSIAVADPLTAGQYWVRIYGNSLKTELLREYGLKVD